MGTKLSKGNQVADLSAQEEEDGQATKKAAYEKVHYMSSDSLSSDEDWACSGSSKDLLSLVSKQHFSEFSNHIFHNYPVAFIGADMSGKIVLFNPYAEFIIGMSKQVVLNTNITEFLLGFKKDMLETMKKNRASFMIDHPKQGFLHFVANYCTVPVNNRQKICLLQLTKIEDDNQVYLLKSMNSLVVENSSIPIVAIDTNCVVTVFNKAAEQTWGYTKEETIGLNVGKLMPQEIAKFHDSKIQEYLKTGVKHIIGYTRPVPGIRKNGASIALELKVAELRLSERRRWFIAYVRDTSTMITDSEQTNRSKLALEIFPATIAQRITDGERFIHDVHRKVAILFCDIVGFTALSQEMNSKSIVVMLNTIFSNFDKQLDEEGKLEKIKTIGDCYMLASGLVNFSPNFANDCLHFALNMIRIVEEINREYENLLPKDKKLGVRIGIHTGEVVAGVVGSRKPAYDVWGSTVNIASRLESTGLANAIHISEETLASLGTSNQKLFAPRDSLVEMKGVGLRQTYIYSPQVL